MAIRNITRLSVICLSCFSFAQQLPTGPANAVRLDPQATAALVKLQQATTWTPATVPRDATASGTITIFENGKPSDVTGTITYKARASGQSSIETQYGDRHNKTVVNGPHAASLTGMKSHPRNSQKVMAFPFMTDVAAFADQSVQTKVQDNAELDGKSCQKLELWREPKDTDKTPDETRRFSHLVLWIDNQTGLLQQVEYRKAVETQLNALTYIRKYSDYRLVNGIMVPFHQEEWDQNQQMYSVDLKSVQFNTGLTDDDFTVAAAQRGTK